MDEQMMMMMQQMQGQQKEAKDAPSVKSMLSEYRKAFGLVRNEAEKKNDDNPWATRLQLPQEDVGAAWGARMDFPEETPNYRDDRDSGDPMINAQEFEMYLGQHPFSQKFGGDLEAMVEELANMVKDPENPMTLGDAELHFIENFEKMFTGWERGEDPFEDQRGGKKK